MIKKKNQQLTGKEVEKLLSQQTIVILNAVDEKLGKMEFLINQKIDRLTTTLDKFLRRRELCSLLPLRSPPTFGEGLGF